jgi:hypothetical protein
MCSKARYGGSMLGRFGGVPLTQSDVAAVLRT